MAVSIGTNVLALKVQRNLGRAAEDLSRSSEMLASGRRINRASDDAAGLAISSTLNTQSRLYTTASRNIADGISVFSLADAALEAQSGLLGRLSELAEQSASGTYSNRQRAALHKEYSALVSEFNRISESTDFNGIRLLSSGASVGITLQVGVTGNTDSQLTSGSVTSGVYQGTVAVNTDSDGDGDVDALDNLSGSQYAGNVRYFANVGELSSYTSGAVFQFELADSQGQQRTVYVAPIVYGLSASQSINGWARYAAFSDDQGTFRSVSASTVTVSNANTSFSLSLSFLSGATASLSVDFSATRFVSTNSGSSASPIVPVDSDVIAATGVETATRARVALDSVTNARTRISSLRATIGAFQSRLATSLNVVSVSAETSTQAASRIVDADIASEAAEAVRNSILQRSAAALLGQANQTPKIALSLLASV